MLFRSEETEVCLSDVLHDLKTIISGQIHACLLYTSDIDGYIQIPRGLRENIIQECEKAGISVDVSDQRETGQPISCLLYTSSYISMYFCYNLEKEEGSLKTELKNCLSLYKIFYSCAFIPVSYTHLTADRPEPRLTTLACI